MDAKQRKVSVVIPCYNSSAFLPAAIESAFAQTVGVHEVIVIDDGSTEDVAAALCAIDDPRLQIIRTDNYGISHARNVGCERATGDTVGLLDADDIWYPNKLERQLCVFAEEPGAVVVGAQMHHIGKRDMTIGVTGLDALDDDAQRSVRTAHYMPFAISSVVIDRNAYQAAGGFDEALKDMPIEDLEFLSRVAALGSIRTVGEPLGAYRVHSGSVSARHFRTQRHAMRFLHARALAREAGGDLTWQTYLDTRTGKTREWFEDTAAALYRAAGAQAADGHYAGATWRLGVSVVLHPAYALRRIKKQRVFHFLRARKLEAGREVIEPSTEGL
jgi:glycosyltransferase involved in cell wall biosynthesis